MHTHAPHAHLGKVDDIRWWAVARDDAVDSCEQGVGLLPAACSQDLLRAASSKRRPTCERTRCERHRGTAGWRMKWGVPWARQVTRAHLHFVACQHALQLLAAKQVSLKLFKAARCTGLQIKWVHGFVCVHPHQSKVCIACRNNNKLGPNKFQTATLLNRPIATHIPARALIVATLLAWHSASAMRVLAAAPSVV
jgi:hypothetical protein